MTKFNSDEKIQSVMSYEKRSESLKSIAKSIVLHYSEFLNWIKQYEDHGEKAFIKGNTSFPAQINLFNIPSHSTLLGWQKSLKLQGINTLQSKKKGTEAQKDQTLVDGSVGAFQAEVEHLKMENA